jgi:acyl-coenzyme A thioesterase PaaI-like protein
MARGGTGGGRSRNGSVKRSEAKAHLKQDGADGKWAEVRKAWTSASPGKFIGRGHPIGDFLEAYDWDVLEEEKGHVRVRAHLPRHVRNLRGQLFGGFTGTYVDFIGLNTVRAGSDRAKSWGYFLATTNMRVDYFEPITDPHFVVDSRLLVERGRTCFVECRFYNADGHLAVFALVTMRKLVLSEKEQ